MKYPATVIGAISSSAPILQFGDQVPCDSFSRIVTKDYELAAQDCPKAIQRSWSVIEEFWRTQSGRDWLKDTFHLCGPLDNKTVKVDDFRNWLITGWSYMVRRRPNSVAVTCKAKRSDFLVQYETSNGFKLFRWVQRVVREQKTKTKTDVYCVWMTVV